MPSIRNPKEFGSGCLFALTGIAAIALGAGYPIGTAARMGPGYFPRGLGLILLAIGLVLVFRGLRTRGTALAITTVKPLSIVLGSVVLFGVAVVPLGLVLATILLVVTSSVASHDHRWKESLIASVVLAAFVVVAFGYGLQLQLPIWPSFLVAR